MTLHAVQGLVVRRYQVSVRGDTQARGIRAACLKAVDLIKEGLEIDNHAIAHINEMPTMTAALTATVAMRPSWDFFLGAGAGAGSGRSQASDLPHLGIDEETVGRVD